MLSSFITGAALEADLFGGGGARFFLGQGVKAASSLRAISAAGV
jgi:hypothetical protein